MIQVISVRNIGPINSMNIGDKELELNRDFQKVPEVKQRSESKEVEILKKHKTKIKLSCLINCSNGCWVSRKAVHQIFVVLF